MLETVVAVLVVVIVVTAAVALLLDVMSHPERWRTVFEDTRWERVAAWIVVLALAAIVGLVLGGAGETVIAGVVVVALVMLVVVFRITALWRDGPPR